MFDLQEKTLLYLLKKAPQEGISINEIARKIEISPSAAHKTIHQLAKEQHVKKHVYANAHYYKINKEQETTRKLLELLLLKEKKELPPRTKIYVKDLEQMTETKMILLYGSILEKKEYNDVDVIIITDKPKEALEQTTKITELRTKPIHPIIITKKELEQQKNKPAIKEALQKGTIIKGEQTYLEVKT